MSRLQVDPSERKIMLTEAPMNPVSNRVRMTEMMFEKYGFAGAHIDIQALLVLYSQGETPRLTPGTAAT